MGWCISWTPVKCYQLTDVWRLPDLKFSLVKQILMILTFLMWITTEPEIVPDPLKQWPGSLGPRIWMIAFPHAINIVSHVSCQIMVQPRDGVFRRCAASENCLGCLSCFTPPPMCPCFRTNLHLFSLRPFAKSTFKKTGDLALGNNKP